MNFLKFAVLSLGVVVALPAQSSEVTFDFERLKTTHGKVYRDIMVLDSDRHGLLFRHARGIAKLNFTELSMNLRMLYEPVEDMQIEGPPEPDETGEETGFDWQSLAPLVITARTRVEIPLNRGGNRWVPCVRYRQTWPNHWPRYHPALRLAIPECRALAVEDFLITTGLAPRPCGVTTYRLPYNRADLLY